MRTRISTVVVVLCAAGLLTTACRIDTTSPAATAPTSGATTPGPGGGLAVGDPNAPMPAPNTCRAGQQDGQPLPDPRCTPGAINPAVTQATINSTICVSGWTKTVRPSTSVTGRMKKKSDTSYGLPTTEQGEYDHF